MLWEQLNEQCTPSKACEYITIPHNSNLSNGLLLAPYANLEHSLENRRSYAQTRLDREPLMEIFQHKGASERVNGLNSVLGVVDELCEFEQARVLGEVSQVRHFERRGTEIIFHQAGDSMVRDCRDETGTISMFGGGCISRNDFLRTALLTGLKEKKGIGLNTVHCLHRQSHRDTGQCR